MKEKGSFKRFDLFAALAVLGVVLVLLFEAIFIFEFYRVDYSKVEPYLPASVKEWLASATPGPVDEQAGVSDEPEDVMDAEEPVPPEGDLSAEETDLVAPETKPVQTNMAAEVETETVPATNQMPDAESVQTNSEAIVEEEPVSSTNALPTVLEESESGEQTEPAEETDSDKEPEPEPVG